MSIIKYIEELIEKKSANNAFVVSDFIEYADYETVKKSLARLEKKGIIRRIIRGVYDKPVFSQIINEIQLFFILLCTYNCGSLRLHVKWKVYKLLAVISFFEILLTL